MGVLKPWENITVNQSENKYSVNVWGRTYPFENSILPTSIISKGEELLYSPICLDMEFKVKKS